MPARPIHTYYNYFASPWLPPTQPSPNSHAPPTLATVKVDYAVLADNAAAMNWDAANPDIIAAYQVDLNGRLVRYKEGKVGGADITTLLAADPSRPFYYAPAVLHIGETATNKVVLALASGSADEASPPTPDITTTLYLRSHTTGASFDANYNFTCAVGSLATCTNVDATKITDSTLWPPATAKPVGSPLIVWNDLGGGSRRVEVFFLLYTTSAAASCTVTSGTTYLVRISVNTTDPTKNVVESIQKTSGRAGGMTLAGAGKRVVFHAQIDVVLDRHTVVQPDILFIRSERLGIVGEKAIDGAPDLVIEILSPSTRRTDVLLKSTTYARFGVPCYWIMDPDLDRVELYRIDPLTGSYRLVAMASSPAVAATEEYPGLQIPLAEVFPPEASRR